MRKSGILLPVFSLPSPYGIGCFSKEALEFIDFLAAAGQSFWQILPLGPTSYGDSPYQSPSAFAGNPYFIDPDSLKEEGLLTEGECISYSKSCPKGNMIDYSYLYKTRFIILKRAFSRFTETEDFLCFEEKEKSWLNTYAEFAAIKDYFSGAPFKFWDKDIRMRAPEKLKALTEKLKEEIRFYKFLQYFFQKQWLNLRKYANTRGIQIIGDMPIYTAMDSVESWASPELFAFDEKGEPTFVAGCPPDYFSCDGQLWGNPVYRWEAHKSTGYRWWAERLKRSMELYDIVRIDHFRAFESYYEIPAESTTARCGRWRKGPGIDFFNEINMNCKNVNIIAEDLGFITPEVRSLLAETKYPGMKVMQFAFDSREASDYLPHSYGNNSVVYTGTHDNSTTLGWAKEIPESDLVFAKEYMGYDGTDPKAICRGMIRLAMGSVADTCIIPLQDYMMLDNSARINTPGTLGGNWRWRCELPSDAVKKEILQITKLYGRE